MATNLALDDKLILEAQKVGAHLTKKDAVTAALMEYIRFRQQQNILQSIGQIQFDPKYSYKKQRKKP